MNSSEASKKSTKTSIPREKKSYHHGDLKNALVMAGLEVIEEQGVAQLNLREVARRAGVTHAAPYRHFEDKDALLVAIAEHGFGQLKERIDNVLATTPSVSTATATNQIILTSRAYIQFAQMHPAMFRLMFGSIVGQRMKYPSLYVAAKQSLQILFGIIREGQRSGELVPGEPEELAVALWGMMHGLAVLVIENQIPSQVKLEQYHSTEKYTDALLQRMIGGILSQ